MNVNAKFVAASAICAIGLTAPVASQGSKDAALEAACRSTEVTAPESCPCTITAARKAGLNDTELASLFKDDGHSQPVDQAKYGRFWLVKSQCIADATMANLGITSGNPLPGVPANMRPGMPLPGGAPQRARPAPGPATTLAPAPAPAIASAGVAGLARTTGETQESGTTFVTTTYTLQGSDFVFSYEKALDAIPGLVERARAMAEDDLARLLEYDEPADPGAVNRDSQTLGWARGRTLQRLWPVFATGFTQNRPQSQFRAATLVDGDLKREIAWTDVFEPRVWNGVMREHYCAGLDAERLVRGTWQGAPACPDFDKLLIDFVPADDGSLALDFTALAYIAGSYAEGPYEVRVPLTATLLNAVRPAYRDAFAGVVPSREQPLIKRAGRRFYDGIAYYDRDTVNLDFDYSWNAGRIGQYNRLNYELEKRAAQAFAVMSKRADAMVAAGRRGPIKFEGTWSVWDGVGNRLQSLSFGETRFERDAKTLLPEREGDYVLWDAFDERVVTFEEVFPKDWNTTIRQAFCNEVFRILSDMGEGRSAQCPGYEQMQITVIRGMEDEHLFSFTWVGPDSRIRGSSFSLAITPAMKSRANPKYRADLVAYQPSE